MIRLAVVVLLPCERNAHVSGHARILVVKWSSMVITVFSAHEVLCIDKCSPTGILLPYTMG